MAKQYSKVSVNLLREDTFSRSVVGKSLKWALSIGRYIVVFTELIVILSFLSRFKFDRELTDLNTAVFKQKAIIESYGDLETRVRKLQQVLTFIEQKQQIVQPHEILSVVQATLPTDVRIDQIQLDQSNVSLSGVALSQNGFEQMLLRLQNLDVVSAVSVSSIEVNDDIQTMNFLVDLSLFSQKVDSES